MVGAVQSSGDAMQRVFEKQRALQEQILAQKDDAEQKVKAVYGQSVHNSANNKQFILDTLKEQSKRGTVLDITV